ncbi:MAG: ABC transporter permease [Actinomycetota bacterium]
MLRLIGRRLLTVVPTLLIVTFGVFLLVTLLPADPAVVAAGGESATPQSIEQARRDLHLDEPVLAQYWRWLTGAVRGDLGDSYTRKTAVGDDLRQRVPVTMGLVLAATVFAVVLAVPLGILSGLRPSGAVDQGSRVLASLSVAVPSFLLALFLVIVFAVKLQWLPPNGYVKLSESPGEWLRYITLPAIALGMGIAAAIMRQLRAALVDELDSNHIRTGWAIGGAAPRVVGVHGLKNASSPAITILGLQIAGLVGGTVLVEQIFSIPGIGFYLLGAITQADVPVIQGCVLVLAVIQILMSLTVDIAYALLNPKVRVAA